MAQMTYHALNALFLFQRRVLFFIQVIKSSSADYVIIISSKSIYTLITECFFSLFRIKKNPKNVSVSICILIFDI